MSMWAFVLCAAAVLVLTLIPTQPPVVTTGWDKSNHLLAFGAMTWLVCKACPQRMLSDGMSQQEIQDDFPELTAEDILAVLAYAAEREHQVLSLHAYRHRPAYRGHPVALLYPAERHRIA